MRQEVTKCRRPERVEHVGAVLRVDGVGVLRVGEMRGIDPDQVREDIAVTPGLRGKRPLALDREADVVIGVLARVAGAGVGGVLGGRALRHQGEAVGVMVGVEQIPEDRRSHPRRAVRSP